jgi:hypothetical protein
MSSAKAEKQGARWVEKGRGVFGKVRRGKIGRRVTSSPRGGWTVGGERNREDGSIDRSSSKEGWTQSNYRKRVKEGDSPDIVGNQGCGEVERGELK